MARRVTHPNVCRVFDVGFHIDAERGDDPESTPAFPSSPWSCCAAKTLRTRLRRLGARPPAEALTLMEQIASGLDAATAPA